MNLDYTERDLEEYGKYMDFIRQCIIEECLIKFKLNIKEEQIELGHIRKDGDRWVFYYDILKTSGDIERNGMSKQLSYDKWKLLLIKENRDRRINELLEGLDKPEKDKLGI